MFDNSARYQKLNEIALENGHIEKNGKPEFLFSLAK